MNNSTFSVTVPAAITAFFLIVPITFLLLYLIRFFSFTERFKRYIYKRTGQRFDSHAGKLVSATVYYQGNASVPISLHWRNASRCLHSWALIESTWIWGDSYVRTYCHLVPLIDPIDWRIAYPSEVKTSLVTGSITLCDGHGETQVVCSKKPAYRDIHDLTATIALVVAHHCVSDYRLWALRKYVVETVEATRSAFKSKQLEDLRATIDNNSVGLHSSQRYPTPDPASTSP